MAILARPDLVAALAPHCAELSDMSGLTPPEMALRLSRCLGRSAESWLAMQDAYDLWHARQQLDLSTLEPVVAATA